MAPYSVLEYGYLSCTNSVVGSSLRDRAVPPELWRELAELIEDEDVNSAGVLYSAGDGPKGVRRLKAKNYIGVIATESGTLEILPKLHTTEITEEAERQALRKVVGNMLSYVTDMDHRVFDPANLQLHTDLYEWFLAIFLRKVSDLVKRGLRSSYESLEGNLSVLKGRLMFPQHLRLNVANSSKLYVRFDEFTTNRPENQLIHAALDLVWKRTNNEDSKRLAKELLFAFADVDRSVTKIKQNKDFKAWQSERGSGQYSELKGWCKAILDCVSPTPSSDSLALDRFDSFLFPAEKLFEQYVANRLQHALSNDPRFKLDTQVGHEISLFSGDAAPLGKKSLLRPDIVIRYKNEGEAEKIIVLDAKWKIFEQDGQISSADLYQLYVYGKYWKASEVGIVAPATKDVRKVEGPFTYQDDSKDHLVRIWLLPYNLLHDNHGHFDWDGPEKTPMGKIIAANNNYFSKGIVRSSKTNAVLT